MGMRAFKCGITDTFSLNCFNRCRPFILPLMVDRVVAMLNYFLVQLVGPKMSAIKVVLHSRYHLVFLRMTAM